ncbi:hypothetical protein CANINC_002673 [Pichia inconspicua]|uniref:ESF1 RRM domain-containing protein n=1 Tax=Pichia inconspicua TaxID=52247 RepID=A0A4V4NFN3_9ASCO|nr:hypothetical protein CANINC_002673 [[Candida] inconspicua]
MSGGGRGASDPRFAKVFSDPRFRNVKKKDLKVKLDERFNKKDLKTEFTLLKSTAKVDKYGRKISQDDQVVDNLDKYYKDENESEEENKSDDDGPIRGEESGENEEQSEDEGEEEDEDEDEENVDESDLAPELDPLAKARGLIDVESSDEDSESDLDSSAEEVTAYSDDSDTVTENIPEQEPTKRIAVVNLDWDHLKSVDLFATFNSFLPQDGYIVNVTIYKSQYGKERLADEEINGPPKEIFSSSKNQKTVSEDEDSDSDEEDMDLAKASRKLIEENTGEEDGFNSTELRKYQLQRLRYYYAIVEFSNKESAIEIYKKCDGTEYESSGNFFDLRYVPEEMEFDEGDIRDSCDKIPNNYQPLEFATDSLRNSKPKLTWDETPIERVQMLTKSFKQGELDELDLKNYLASDSEDESSALNADKYKKLVGNSLKKDEGKEDEDDEDDVDIEFTFTPKGAEKASTNPDGEMSTIEKIKQKEKERRKLRKQKIKELKKEAQSKRKGKKSNEDDAVADAPEIDTEGLPDLKHFNVKEMAKLEKLKSKKNKFKNKRQRELEEQLSKQYGEQDEKLTIDERFAEMVDDHAFAGGSALLKEERRKRKKQKKNQ